MSNPNIESEKTSKDVPDTLEESTCPSVSPAISEPQDSSGAKTSTNSPQKSPVRESKRGSGFVREATLPGVNQSSLVSRVGSKDLRIPFSSIPGVISDLFLVTADIAEETMLHLLDDDGVELLAFSVAKGAVVSPLYIDKSPYLDDQFKAEYPSQDFSQPPSLVLEVTSLSAKRAMTFGELWARGIVGIFRQFEGESLRVVCKPLREKISFPLVLPYGDLLKTIIRQCHHEPRGRAAEYFYDNTAHIEDGWLLQELAGQTVRFLPIDSTGEEAKEFNSQMRLARIATMLADYLTNVNRELESSPPMAMSFVVDDGNWHCVLDDRHLTLLRAGFDYFGRGLRLASELTDGVDEGVE